MATTKTNLGCKAGCGLTVSWSDHAMPSTLVRWAQSWSRRLAAKACRAAWVNMAVQRLMRAVATECWGGVVRVRLSHALGA